MEKMSEIFIRRVDEWLKESEYRDIGPKYDLALKYVANMPKKESDLQQLLEDIERKYSEDLIYPYFGIFVSAAVNKSTVEGITLNVKNPLISYLGLNNNNELTIFGDVKNFTGYNMEGGILTINGNTNSYTGADMHGGELILNGNCKNQLGLRMTGGKITVKGNANGDVATLADGGIVELLGEYKHIGPFTKAKVYHGEKVNG